MTFYDSWYYGLHLYLNIVLIVYTIRLVDSVSTRISTTMLLLFMLWFPQERFLLAAYISDLFNSPLTSAGILWFLLKKNGSVKQRVKDLNFSFRSVIILKHVLVSFSNLYTFFIYGKLKKSLFINKPLQYKIRAWNTSKYSNILFQNTVHQGWLLSLLHIFLFSMAVQRLVSTTAGCRLNPVRVKSDAMNCCIELLV